MTEPGSDAPLLERARQVFQAASELTREERDAFLDSACGDDEALRVEVDSLLASLDSAGGFLEGSVLDPAGAFWVGRRVGDYEILGLLGRGGVGLVFEARQGRPRRTVALKLLRPELADAAIARRFEVEAELLAALEHEGIARIYAAGTVDSELGPQSYLAMERIEGLPLLEYAESKALGLRERVGLVLRTCAAVQHAHERGVIHRDLKPANVLVEPSGQPKVLDFGVARATNADLDIESIATLAGQVIGTVAYMSPEQARGAAGRLDVRTDVYSLGVILYQLLSGRLPLPVAEMSLPEALRSLSEDEPTPLARTATGIPADLATIVGKAIEREPQRRYESVAALAEDLRRFLADEPIRARPPSALYQLRKLAQRNRALVGGIAGAFVLLLAGVVVTGLGQLREQRLRRRAERLQLEAEAALELSRFDAYAANLAVAEAAIVAADVVNARSRLDVASPGLRGWEWTHLRLRLDRSEPRIDNTSGIESMGLTPDGSTVVTGGTDRSVRAWRLATGELLWSHSLGSRFTARGLAVDPRAELVAAAMGSWYAGRGGYGPLTLLSLEDGSLVAELPGHTDVVQALAFHPTRPWLASASSDRTVRLWDIQARREVAIVAEHALDAYDVDFSPDGRFLASVGWGGRLNLVEVASGELVQSLEIGERLTSLGWSPDGRQIVAGTWQGRLLWIDRMSGTVTHLEGRHLNSVERVRFTSGDELLSAGSDNVLLRHRLPLGETTGTFLGSTATVTAFEVEAGGASILSGGLDGWVRRWRADTQDVPRLEPHEAWVYDVSLSADGRTLASTGPASRGARPDWAQILVHDLEPGATARRIPCEGEPLVWSCEFAPDSARLVSAGSRTGAIVWDVESGQPLQRLAHDGELRYAVFDPSGDRIATSCSDLGVRIWDSRSGALLLPPMVWEPHRPYCVRFSPDGLRLAATYYGGAVALWDARDGSLVAGRVAQHASNVYVARFSPDGRWLATGGRDRRIQIWEAESLLPLGPALSNPAVILDVDFSPDGSRLVVGDESGLLRIFETAGWRQVLGLRGHHGAIRAVAHDSTGRFVYSGSADGDVRVWDGGSAEERLVDRLFGELLLADDVVAAIETSAALDDAARARAIALAEARRLDTEQLQSLAWAAALAPSLSSGARQAALRRARAALRARPEDPALLGTLGAVLFRSGELEQARRVLEQARSLRADDPWDGAFLTLTLAALGQTAAARAELARLEELAGDGRWTSEVSLLAVLAEARRAAGSSP